MVIHIQVINVYCTTHATCIYSVCIALVVVMIPEKDLIEIRNYLSVDESYLAKAEWKIRLQKLFFVCEEISQRIRPI